MAFAGEVAVFVETNLGTRIVITVSLDITSADFKLKLEETHSSCLPSLGEIQVHGLMVQRKAQCYYLADSVPIKYIFRHDQKPWFIKAEARLVNRSQHPSISNNIDKSPQGVVGRIRGVNNKTNKALVKLDSRKFASLDKKREFVGSYTTEPDTILRSSLPTARAAKLNNSDRETVGKCGTVSKKLTVAANNIRMQGKSSTSCSLSSSIFRSRTHRKRCVDGKTVASLAKFLVFEIPDTED